MGLNQHIYIEFALQNPLEADSYLGFLPYPPPADLSARPIIGELSAASLNWASPFGGTSLSPFFANMSFLFLFLAMTFYWFDLIFSNKNAKPLSGLGLQKVFASLGAGFLGKSAIFLSNLSLISLLCIRWKESGHFPLSNLYESLMFLSWSCTFILIFLIYNSSSYTPFKFFSLAKNFNKAENMPSPDQGLANQVFLSSNKYNSFQGPWIEKLLGSILAPCALLLNSFATFSLPKEMQQAGPLVPALQSNWLMMHVTVMIISYAALILGSLLSIAFLIYIKVFNSKVILMETKLRPPALLNGGPLINIESKTRSLIQNFNIESNLDYLSYRIIGIGFPFLTIGILSGAVWANEAWGSYWSWDPKETWALLTWLIFAIYLHTRLTKSWEGERPAIIASLGFVVVWICYLGVNLLGEGLHSYGFLK
jgi:cytochrome c-type biogenesis protein CcsB